MFVRLSLDTFLEVAGILRTFFLTLNFVASDCAPPPELERSATAFYTICIIMFPIATLKAMGLAGMAEESYWRFGRLMKKIIKLMALGATAAMFALPVAARTLPSQLDTLVQDQCTQENKDAWYAAFRESFKTDPVKAYDSAKKYLTACSAEDTQITQYLKKWVGAYDKENRKVLLPQLLYKEKKYPEAFTLGKEILTDEPENLTVLIDLGYGGYLAATAKNNSFKADAINYAKKALQLIDSGKTVDNWYPFGNKNEALAYLNYSIGALTLPQDPSSALSYLIKAAQFESDLKKLPFFYAYIAGAYENGPYAKLSEAYKQYANKDETPESKLALANINQVVDRMIDAYARAVATAGSDPKFQAAKPEWVESLAQWYKYRHDKSDAGMNELVASILTKPLPPEPTPLTSLPPSATPAATPASGNGSPGANSGSGTNTNLPASSTQPASKTTTPASPNKTGVPIKPRSNHPR